MINVLQCHTNHPMPISLLIAQDSLRHVHLIIGANSLASARCAKSIEVGARPKIIAPADANLHHVLSKRIEDGEAEWIKKNFEEEDLRNLGRDEVENVVDAVFVTTGGHVEQSRYGVWVFDSDIYIYSDARQWDIESLQTATNTCECDRCAKIMYFHPPIHIL